MIALLGSLLRALPPGSPEWIYTHLLRGPLRTLANRIILSLLPAEVTIPEGTVVLNPQDPIVSGALAFGVYEPYETELFREEVKSDMTVIDIGANIGYFATIAASRVGKGKVIAFEPEPENYAVLEATMRRNGFLNVSLPRVAVADKEGSLMLNLYDTNKGKHSLVKDSRDSKGFSGAIEVSTVTLDSYCAAHGLVPDLIKMDIEGAESLALRGMPQSLAVAKRLFLEFTPSAIRKAGDDPLGVLGSLRERGFSLYAIDERKKALVEIASDAACVAAIPEGRAANLFCKK